MKHNKLIKLSALLLLPLSLFSCDKAEPETSFSSSGGPSLKISETSLTLEKFDSYLLTYTLKESNEYVYWTTSNQDVATVEDGLIKGVSVGQATISVHAGGLVSSCSLDVIPPSQAAILHLSHEDITIAKSSYFDVEVYSTYKNVRYDNPFEISFAPSSPTDVVTYTKVENKIRIQGVKAGETLLSIHMEAFDTVMNKTIRVEVIDI